LICFHLIHFEPESRTVRRLGQAGLDPAEDAGAGGFPFAPLIATVSSKKSPIYEENNMNARLLASVVLACLFLVFGSPVFAQEDVKSTVTSIEKNLWDAWKNNDTAVFQQHLADEAVGVGPQGVLAGKDQLIRQMTDKPCDVRDFSFSDWEVHQISDDTVLVTYKAKQDATCDGTQIPAEVVASSVYVKRDGKWLAASHQETPLMDPSTMRAE
jgi:uncharacterized protein (TIGR02246 family)